MASVDGGLREHSELAVTAAQSWWSRGMAAGRSAVALLYWMLRTQPCLLLWFLGMLRTFLHAKNSFSLSLSTS